jgi:hypothetical protein
VSAAERPARSLVEDVRRFGLVSADLVVDRFVRLTERAIGGDPRHADGSAAGRPTPPVPGLADGATALATGWLRLVEATASLADRAAADGTAAGTLELPPTAPGRTAEASLWVHNTTASPAPLDLAATSLAAPGATPIASDAVSLSPTRLQPSAPRSSAEVRVRVQVPPGQEPGHYQGLVLSSGVGPPVLVRLEVRADDGAGS